VFKLALALHPYGDVIIFSRADSDFDERVLSENIDSEVLTLTFTAYEA